MSRTAAYVRQTVVPSSPLLPYAHVAFSIATKQSYSREFFNTIGPEAVVQTFDRRAARLTPHGLAHLRANVPAGESDGFARTGTPRGACSTPRRVTASTHHRCPD